LSGESLLKDVQALFASMPGAPEREHLLTLLPRAAVLDLSDDFVRATSDTLALQAHTIEHNLDFLSLPADVCWIEWNEAARSAEFMPADQRRNMPDRIGVLLSRAEEADDLVVGTVCWRMPDGHVDHAAAFFVYHENQMTSLSQQARRSLSQVNKECWARIMALVYTHVPPGFSAEMEVLEDLRDDTPGLQTLEHDARRDVSAEALFAISALLLLYTPSAVLAEVDDRIIVNLAPQVPSWKDRLLKKVSKPGFTRRKTKAGAILGWRPV
jgi:hypothetical protein